MDQPSPGVRYTDSHKGKGSDYHQSFSPEVNPYRAMVWRLEQATLDRILAAHPVGRPTAHLDFACGTGRILQHLAGRTGSSTGVDVSASMLEVARRMAPAAELIEADLTQVDRLADRSFDLITAFRFFPNAEPELRRSVLAVLVRHLAPGGMLVFNNHKNSDSPRLRLARLRGRSGVGRTWSRREIDALLGAEALEVRQAYPVATLPLSERHVVLPVRLAEPLERGLSRWRGLAGIAQDTIYVAGRVPPRPGAGPPQPGR